MSGISGFLITKYFCILLRTLPSPTSYSILLAVSCAAVRDTSSIMVGQYFKMRRDLAEMWSIAGVGIGVLAFSLLYFQAVR